MRHLVIGQRQKAHNFSAFHWSTHGCLITTDQHFVTTRVVHLPKRTETSLITESDHSYCSYARPAQPGPNRTRLCGPCIAAKAGSGTYVDSNHHTHVNLHRKSISVRFKLNGYAFRGSNSFFSFFSLSLQVN